MLDALPVPPPAVEPFQTVTRRQVLFNPWKNLKVFIKYVFKRNIFYRKCQNLFLSPICEFQPIPSRAVHC